jgi:hypothetical protein
MTVRAIFQAVKVTDAASPHDTIQLKIFYPAEMSDSGKQNWGIFPADLTHAPFKIVIFFNGINCGAEMYQWLAVKLAENGLVVVMFSWIVEMGGRSSLTPGVDSKMLAPNTYGSPTASALPTILSALEELQVKGVLAGLLDLQNIILGGHSAGGRVAIESANPQFYPQVSAAFGYGVHTAAPVALGYSSGQILPLPDALPLMIIGGTCDGVIAQSSNNYGVDWEKPTTPVERTFTEAIAGGRNDSYLLLLEGANHFAIAHPFDDTTGTSFLDYPATRSPEQLRNLLFLAIALFIDAHVRHNQTALATLNREFQDKGAIAFFVRK